MTDFNIDMMSRVPSSTVLCEGSGHSADTSSRVPTKQKKQDKSSHSMLLLFSWRRRGKFTHHPHTDTIGAERPLIPNSEFRIPNSALVAKQPLFLSAQKFFLPKFIFYAKIYRYNKLTPYEVIFWQLKKKT